jgi:hypothetical protein
LIVFDVNETLLNLQTLEPTFERILGEKAAMRLWFANLITYSSALTKEDAIMRRGLETRDIGGAGKTSPPRLAHAAGRPRQGFDRKPLICSSGGLARGPRHHARGAAASTQWLIDALNGLENASAKPPGAKPPSE